MNRITTSAVAVAAVLMLGLLGGCSTIDPDAPALHGDYSGDGFSGAVAVVRLPGDIPHVPESRGKAARWSSVEMSQVLFLDADCQRQLYSKLPSWAQAIAKEGGWGALAVAVGEGAFVSAFPGADVVRYVLGGLGYGAAAGANTGRYRQDGAEKAAQGYCVMLNAWEAKQRYGILTGLNFVLWYGDGHTSLPAPDNRGVLLPRTTDDPPTPFFIH
ncbi:hypothetical protein COU19_03095 [Candidatus Kaiserbacteria bacterium CG10_big_fil_rev_8_21_14_0_10_56_12]|uniref:Lipoprotein n=1 Tax=Candidatus Kaiserbacteria bacterium CG10_big_fil_rev_8_21_14_0_10_56_12 TaxID=1974611 RepID=A0A2H0U9D9_9BACT|nr:MAG: hypothetical protein COU19_03095 [Candidatus Kaiserbacteria bacterium CG10_big_fil_rev_8_21_14_0_10_56_12]